MKLSTELKKATQECLHAEKMAQKWTEKAEHRRNKVTELENLAMIDLLRKKKVSIDGLEQMLQHLPQFGSEAPMKQEENKEQPQEGKEKEELPHENTTKE